MCVCVCCYAMSGCVSVKGYEKHPIIITRRGLLVLEEIIRRRQNWLCQPGTKGGYDKNKNKLGLSWVKLSIV